MKKFSAARMLLVPGLTGAGLLLALHGCANRGMETPDDAGDGQEAVGGTIDISKGGAGGHGGTHPTGGSGFLGSGGRASGGEAGSSEGGRFGTGGIGTGGRGQGGTIGEATGGRVGSGGATGEAGRPGGGGGMGTGGIAGMRGAGGVAEGGRGGVAGRTGGEAGNGGMRGAGGTAGRRGQAGAPGTAGEGGSGGAGGRGGMGGQRGTAGAAGGEPGTAGAPGGHGGAQGPCADLCAGPVVFTSASYSSGALGIDATCHQTMAHISGIVCGNFVAPRKLTVNGEAIACTGASVTNLPTTADGGYCIQTTAGDYSFAYFSTY